MKFKLHKSLQGKTAPAGGPAGIMNIQWHVTARCQSRCRHCYMTNSHTYENEIKNELSLEDCIKILDHYRFYLDSKKLKGHLNFTGGDPLLREDIFQILEEAIKRGFKTFRFMGNPDSITEEMAKKLFRHHVTSYQFSLDGDKTYHDSARKEGSFDLIPSAINILHKAGINTALMFTLCKHNTDKLFPAMTIAAQWGVNNFAFAREVAIGNASEEASSLMPAEEYRIFLLDYLRYAEELNSWGFKTNFGTKDHLFTPLIYGELSEPGIEIMDTRCYMGYTCLNILSDGTVLLCRRLPIVLGHLPGDNLTDIIENHPVMQKVRDPGNFQKCSSCDYNMVCLGNPCVAYGLTGDPFSPDPQCWVQ